MRRTALLLVALTLTACAAADPDSWPFEATPVATFKEPWAMTFLPDGRLLVTEMAGRLMLVSTDGKKTLLFEEVPKLAYGGQGGFGDVVLHPDFVVNKLLYLSYAEAGTGALSGAAVARATLELDASGGHISNFEVIWRQVPKVSGRGHYGHRIAFSPDDYLFITSGERQKFDPAQDMRTNLGKILRLNLDGTVPDDNPFADQGGVAGEVWTLGHRNLLGLAFDRNGLLWNHEMGPRHGDELNLVIRGRNYGYPIVSNGDHYNGTKIPDHETHPEFAAPKAFWVPSIAPAGFMIYSGKLYPDWAGDGFIGGLESRSLIRVEFNGEKATEAERFAMDKRIREVEQGPSGLIWLLEDGKGGRLLKLTPKK
ncbi:MAG: glucose/arabinose dehydrogenase [Gammaproteobacteria bacterium]|jgi:glucose/arabinose dehydrogenase